MTEGAGDEGAGNKGAGGKGAGDEGAGQNDGDTVFGLKLTTVLARAVIMKHCALQPWKKRLCTSLNLEVT